ncbi:ATP-binding protein, partial [Streptomyces sp. NPDC005195]|uniref:ATP-binding protein n=1 Tax=Streptomyces sp. NPDC005195 TaxID=3154561 RepID=UPI0033A50E2E
MTPPSLPQPLDRLPGDEYPHRAGVFALRAAPASVGVARRHVGDLLSEWDIDVETHDNAVLLASELVTNALTHTASEWIVCRLHIARGPLHIEVEDQHRGWTLPARLQPGPEDQRGRGLLLVGALSSDWGVRDTADGSGRIVWAVLPSRSGSPASVSRPPTTNTARPIPHSAEGSPSDGTKAHSRPV